MIFISVLAELRNPWRTRKRRNLRLTPESKVFQKEKSNKKTSEREEEKISAPDKNL